jgi:hypothetical protein
LGSKIIKGEGDNLGKVEDMGVIAQGIEKGKRENL